ncbi:MAG TPA: adenylate/guanylate cyclase domain-containing protein [Thiotrichaceae bacterium]|nr:adenylate/guanylate cyclase domain-containing protein [Thiotrichaceae bacterium]
MSQLLVVLKRHTLRWLLSLAILLFFILHTTGTVEWRFLNALEHQAYDARLDFTMPKTVDSRIVIVDIDEHSLSEIGRWPWNRSVMARLIDQLFDTYEIDVLGMDIVFAEPDDSSGLKKLQALAEGPLKDETAFLNRLKTLETKLDYDALLAQSMQNRRIVLGYAFTTAQEEQSDIEAGKLPPPTFSHEDVQAYHLSYLTGKGFAANLPQFQDNAIAAGHFNVDPDPDGIVRRVPMLYAYKGELYESLSLAITRVALGVQDIELSFYSQGEQAHLENLIVGNRTIPVDDFFQSLVPYRGSRRSFPYVSATDVLHGRIKDPSILKNNIILLGTSAQGLQDLRATPVESIFPGVEIHANMISGMLDNNLMSQLSSENKLETLLLILIGIIMISLLPLFSPLTATIGTLGLSGLVIWMNMTLWHEQDFVLPLATTLLLILTQFLFNMSYGYFLESTNKRHLTNLFGQYVPPELVDEMSKNLGGNQSQFSMEGESRKMTVLFSDVRGFTSLSENLEPKELSQLMNEYLTPMTHIIHEHRGTIDKYMGDAIMAFWGAPLIDQKHARHALDTAMEMLKHLETLRQQFQTKGWPEIKIGIGINTGVMSVGNMGSQFRMAYTVLGDAVNLGSRLEGATKQYGVQLIVSEATRTAVPEYLYRELDRVKVKGKEQPVIIFEPLGLRDTMNDQILEEVAHYEQALGHYRHQRWEVAKQEFAKLPEKYANCQLYQLYVERVEYFIKNPPGEDWDGVYTFTTK